MLCYLRELCCTTMGIPGRRSLRSRRLSGVLLSSLLITEQLGLSRIALSRVVGPSPWTPWHSDCVLGLSLGGVHKGRPQKMPPFPSPSPVRRCPHGINPPSRRCGRPHLASYIALWSD